MATKEISETKEINYWYCPECDCEISNERVTYEETHDVCGFEVECITERVEINSK